MSELGTHDVHLTTGNEQDFHATIEQMTNATVATFQQFCPFGLYNVYIEKGVRFLLFLQLDTYRLSIEIERVCFLFFQKAKEHILVVRRAPLFLLFVRLFHHTN